MPLVKRCVICGQVTESELSAYPYKSHGVACPNCYQKHVAPALRDKNNYFRKTYAK